MYVDPFLLAALVTLLGVTSVLAAVAYVRYRRCEAVYEAYGRSLHLPTPSAPPSPSTFQEDRYITGADFAEEHGGHPAPAPGVSTAIPAEGLLEPEISVSESPRPEPSMPSAASPAAPVVPAAAPGDAFFYEYTAQGFVPIDPYDGPYLPPPSYQDLSGLEEWDPVEALLAPIVAGEASGMAAAPALDSPSATPEQVNLEPVERAPEDGFVWL